MDILVRQYTPADLPDMLRIWNGVVQEGTSFPQVDCLCLPDAETFFAEQSYTAVAVDGQEIVGLYILHPNNVGRCGHIANASYAVKAGQRGKHVGEHLVKHSIGQAGALSFRILQFNAVVATNKWAIRLYTKLGFTPLGPIPGGFHLGQGNYVDIIPFYIALDSGPGSAT